MSASIQRFRHHISRLPFLSFLCNRDDIVEPRGSTDEVTFRFKECEDDGWPSAEEVEAKEHERAEQFKRDQLLPIMGWSTGAPGYPKGARAHPLHVTNNAAQVAEGRLWNGSLHCT
jgi:hypothetical protein